MIVIDASALVAIRLQEPLANRIVQAIENAPHREMSAASFVEAGMVLALRSKARPFEAVRGLEALVARGRIAIVAFDETQARIALDARIRFGKGFGQPAGLNYGDSFSYALAKVRNAPLLFVGDDFTHTDIASALTVA